MTAAFQLNEDAGDDFGLPPDAIWVVYHYTVGDYDGSGFAVAMLPDGSLVEHNMGHCSCFGPWQDLNNKSDWSPPVSVDSWLDKHSGELSAVDEPDMEAVVAQVRKMVGG